MIHQSYRVNSIRKDFIHNLQHKMFTVDKTGAKMIEMLGATFIADEASIFGVPSEEYIKAEIEWYKSQSTNINDIYGPDREPPAAWKYAADVHGNINSNYGKLIFSNQYHNQYKKAVTELMRDPDTRRAEMIYTRPSIWTEFDDNGMSDFICTNAVTYYIRDNKLHAVVQMRSNDVVFGYKNDYAWQQYVMKEIVKDLNIGSGPFLHSNITLGDMIWQVQNLHVYERHFDLVN